MVCKITWEKNKNQLNHKSGLLWFELWKCLLPFGIGIRFYVILKAMSVFFAKGHFFFCLETHVETVLITWDIYSFWFLTLFITGLSSIYLEAAYELKVHKFNGWSVCGETGSEEPGIHHVARSDIIGSHKPSYSS